MRVGIIQARGLELFLAHGLAALDALRVRLTEGEVAGRVFVEERVVEENLLV